jgi:predicted helicase
VCSVDLFNEGVDVPALDRVVILRPTESPVVFLQQLGRGLRRADGKERLIVIEVCASRKSKGGWTVGSDAWDVVIRDLSRICSYKIRGISRDLPDRIL